MSITLNNSTTSLVLTISAVAAAAIWWRYNQNAKKNSEADLAAKKALVRATWKQVEETLGAKATELFYQRLFEQYPGVKPLFAKADMKTQAKHLLKTIGVAVANLDDLDTLVPVLKDLGARHVRYGAELPHYDAVGESLLWTLEKGLGPDVWTPEVAEAWTWVYGVVATTMAEGAKEAQAKKAKA